VARRCSGIVASVGSAFASASRDAAVSAGGGRFSPAAMCLPNAPSRCSLVRSSAEPFFWSIWFGSWRLVISRPFVGAGILPARTA
jgi:hypothetical protein